jgi:hypothetical protein
MQDGDTTVHVALSAAISLAVGVVASIPLHVGRGWPVLVRDAVYMCVFGR